MKEKDWDCRITQLKFYVISRVLVFSCNHIYDCFIEPQRLDSRNSHGCKHIRAGGTVDGRKYMYLESQPQFQSGVSFWMMIHCHYEKSWWLTKKTTKESWLDFQGLYVYIYIYIYIGSSSQSLIGRGLYIPGGAGFISSVNSMGSMNTYNHLESSEYKCYVTRSTPPNRFHVNGQFIRAITSGYGVHIQRRVVMLNPWHLFGWMNCLSTCSSHGYFQFCDSSVHWN